MIRRLLPAATLAFAALLLALPAAVQAQTSPEVERVLKKFDNEPSVLEVQEATRRYAMVDSDQMEGWYTRARLANIIPGKWGAQIDQQDLTRDQLRTKEDLVRSNPDNFNSDLVVEDVTTYDTDQTDGRVNYRLEADWDVSALIFNPDELRVADTVSRLVKVREQVLITVTKLYYERRRLQVEMVLRPPTDAAEQVKLQLRIDELTADIDALTGGWFSKNIR